MFFNQKTTNLLSMKPNYTIFFILLILPFWGFSQTDTTLKKDSFNEATLSNNTHFLVALDSIRTADSIKRADLEAQVAALKSTDNIKKEELLAQIEKIKTEEFNKKENIKRQIDSLKAFVKGYPVAPFNDTLFYVYTKLGAFAPKARAIAIVDKIKTLEKDFFFKPDSLQTSESEQSIDLFYKDLIILSITDKDAIWMGTTKEELANNYKSKIKNAIEKYRDETSIKTILTEIGLAILVILIGWVIIYFVNRLFRWTKQKIHNAKGKYVNGIKIRNYELFTADSEIKALEIVNNILRWLVILLVLYLMIPVLFGIFPWTKNFSSTLLGYVLNPLKHIILSIWNYLPNLITIIVILFVFSYVIKGIKFFKKEIENERLAIPGFYPDWATPTYQIIRILLFAFLIIVIFPYLPGSNSQVFKGVSVFLGVLFTFGSSGSLSNVIAGLVLTYMRAYKIGDRVKIGDITGDIVSKSLLVTRIRTIKNEDITIPNSTIMGSHTINYSSSAKDLGLIVNTTITIGYDAPWKQVHQLMIDAALATELILKEPKPFVLQTSLDDFYVSYQINAYTNEANQQAVIYSNLHQNIQDKFNEAGVEIMSSHYSNIRDGNQVTIPKDYLPKDYTAPNFNVDIKKEQQ